MLIDLATSTAAGIREQQCARSLAPARRQHASAYYLR
jgi:hypothetical protein